MSNSRLPSSTLSHKPVEPPESSPASVGGNIMRLAFFSLLLFSVAT